jgi:hypothetical protein
MSFLDKAKDLLGQHDEQVDQALEHGGGLAKDRFAGHDRSTARWTGRRR